MKIGFLVDWFPRSSQPFIVKQITGVHERGYDVRIYATGWPDDNDWADVPDEITDRTTYTPIPYNKGKRVLKGLKLLARHSQEAPVTTAKTLNPVRFGTDALSLRPLFRLAPMIGEDLDILHCHFGTKGRIGTILKRSGFNGKLVTSIHGHGLRMAEENPVKYESLFSTGDCFLANSRNTYERLRDFGIDEHRVVHYPVGIAVADFPFKWTGSTDPMTGPIKILTVARLEELKGIEYSLRAIRKLVQSTDYTIEYHLVGDGSQREVFEDIAQQLGISEYVYFHGHQPRREVISWLIKSDIFLLPSVEEAFGMVLLEAQAVGLPVVATSVGGIPEAVNEPDSATLVPAGNPDAIVSALRKLLEEPDKWPEVGGAGREYVARKFDINELNDRLISIYEDVLSEK